MKKTIHVTILLSLLSINTAHSVTFDVSGGYFGMYDPLGVSVTESTNFYGYLEQDYLTKDIYSGQIDSWGSSSAQLFGYNWIMHSFDIQMTSANTASGTMLLDWAATTNILITMDFAVDFPEDTGGECYSYDHDTGIDEYVSCNGVVKFIAIDGDGDGILGNAMDNGPFPGFSIALSFCGLATPESWNNVCDDFQTSAVPIPAVIWLFSSGLMGLVGFVRRNKA